MIEVNKRENIREEIERAMEAKKAAELLFINGFIKDAVSKLYYFLLYSIRALLLTKGVEPKSHEGALRLFGFHFVKEGIFNSKDSHIFSKLMKFREEADYNPSYIFAKEDFSDLRREAENLFQTIKVYLGEKGYFKE
ncbi:MAG: HEPN domain-containing protein [Thermodesulfobacteriota bacterium]